MVVCSTTPLFRAHPCRKLTEARLDVPAPTRDDVRGHGWVRIQPAEEVYLGAGAELLAFFPEVALPAHGAFLVTANATTVDDRPIVARECLGDCDCYDENGCEVEPVSLGGRREAPGSREAWSIHVGFSYEAGPGRPLEPAPPSATAGALVDAVRIEALELSQGEPLSFANDYVTLFPIVGAPR
ncbi:MAG: hypothetical protein HYV63_22920 [Candidatus Schekmanbacteria bacterium]|nr:hypothetical protein [Candidatus Schekmanbacteria bacterium]